MAQRDAPPADALKVASGTRRGRSVTVGAAAEPLIAPTLRKRGFIETRVARNWPEIVGDALAAETVPVRLVFPKGERQDATLHIRVTGPVALELQHLAPMVIERINGYFGYRAVAGLALRQAPAGHAAKRRPSKPAALTADEERDLAARIARVADPALRQSLLGLGRAMRGSRKGAARGGKGAR